MNVKEFKVESESCIFSEFQISLIITYKTFKMTIYANLSDLLSDILDKKVSSVNRKKEDERGLASSCENIQVIFEVTFIFNISNGLNTYIISRMDQIRSCS